MTKESKEESVIENEVHPLIGNWIVTFYSLEGTPTEELLGFVYEFKENNTVVVIGTAGYAIETIGWKPNNDYEKNGSSIEGSFNMEFVNDVYFHWDFIITNNGDSATLIAKFNKNSDEEIARCVLTRQ